MVPFDPGRGSKRVVGRLWAHGVSLSFSLKSPLPNQGRFGTAAEMAWNDKLTEHGNVISKGC